jgi:hypothetical protein
VIGFWFGEKGNREGYEVPLLDAFAHARAVDQRRDMDLEPWTIACASISANVP